VRLWFDEDLSPTLVRVAHELGFEGTCNRDRGVLGISDATLRKLVQREKFVLVTDNASDFRPMYVRDDVHPGLIVVPAGHGRARQQTLTRDVITWVANAALQSDQDAADYMLNRLVEIDQHGSVTSYELP
jgi:predicted nuclease of predicted toxin-antitoxin system